VILASAQRYYGKDTDPAHYEPGGDEYISGALTEALLMSKVLPAQEFAAWFDRYLPRVSEVEQIMQPAHVSDPTDPKIAHLDGLNLARLVHEKRPAPPARPPRCARAIEASISVTSRPPSTRWSAATTAVATGWPALPCWRWKTDPHRAPAKALAPMTEARAFCWNAGLNLLSHFLAQGLLTRLGRHGRRDHAHCA
jgi:hypothetical protein